ncbi:NEQ430 [Nanoarchaeum equitans Kin4-M]|uniref:Replication factor C large subunit n=1 Tax=Nanoarchaeum equitans (strain Kin4-M) TaxID=228908 RepID=RFCL_NANEQ|nr:RecName: Full=Replication factor C large subunit; Short=RFC large subunit; AltName: Full=Clamp loader large subunit [Nanoarchaeum equitans Kin4-M]AAR39275.1 NEQ430 [Nanoarchaeum equitans Kin4-M]
MPSLWDYLNKDKKPVIKKVEPPKKKEIKRDIPLFIKYRPKTLDEVENQEQAKQILRDYVINYKKKYKGKALLLYGPPGTGKTSSVYALANELGYEVLEVNASDERDAIHIHHIVGEASKGKPLFHKGRIILVDEVDGLSGKEDRGGVGALVNIIKQSSWPIICTANDPWDQKLKKLREISIMVEFKRLSPKHVYNVLKKIVTNEKIKISDKILWDIAYKSGGDLRAAINDLETIIKSGIIDENFVKALGNREQEIDIFKALGIMFKTENLATAVSAFNNVDLEFDEIFPWLEENIPVEYKRLDDIYRAYYWLGKADIFRKRIIKTQHWRLLVYAQIDAYGGIALAKNKKYPGFTRYQPPKRLKLLAQMKEKLEKLREHVSKLREKLHMSKRDIIKYYVSFALKLKNLNKTVADKFLKAIGLSLKEIEEIR